MGLRFWTTWGPKDCELATCTIITGEPNELAAPIHNRMPVILAPSDYDRWLNVEQPNAMELLRPYAAEQMTAYPVSTRVNSPNNEHAEILASKG